MTKLQYKSLLSLSFIESFYAYIIYIRQANVWIAAENLTNGVKSFDKKDKEQTSNQWRRDSHGCLVRDIRCR